MAKPRREKERWVSPARRRRKYSMAPKTPKKAVTATRSQSCFHLKATERTAQRRRVLERRLAKTRRLLGDLGGALVSGIGAGLLGRGGKKLRAGGEGFVEGVEAGG